MANVSGTDVAPVWRLQCSVLSCQLFWVLVNKNSCLHDFWHYQLFHWSRWSGRCGSWNKNPLQDLEPNPVESDVWLGEALSGCIRVSLPFQTCFPYTPPPRFLSQVLIHPEDLVHALYLSFQRTWPSVLK